MLNAGADKVSINTAAVQNPEFVREAAERFGSQCIVVAVDAKRVSAEDELLRWEIFTHGGRKPTGLEVVEWVGRMVRCGPVKSADQYGPRWYQDWVRSELKRAVSEAVNVPIIASGG